MDILEAYKNVKKVFNNESFNSNSIEKDIEIIIDILNEWLESSYCSLRDFECLMYAIKDDYLYTGKAYRGITLLKKSDKSIKNRICFYGAQSFSKDKKIALGFANNCKVTIGNEVNIDKDVNDVIPILMEINCDNAGIDLHKFAQDMIVICKNIIKSEDIYEDFESALSYALEEEEVLFYPSIISILRDDVEKIKIYEV